MAEDIATDASGAIEHFEWLASHPININSASKEELENLMLLNDFQIVALKDYISTYGAILSFAELSLVYGFNDAIVNSLKPYIVLGPTKNISQSIRQNAHSTFYAKSYHKIPLLPDTSINKSLLKDYLQIRSSTAWRDKITLSFLTEKDEMENFGDFTSLSVALSDLKLSRGQRGIIIDKIVLGDMSVRFGQGLTLWNSGSFSGAEENSGYCKTAAPLASYTSSDEDKGLRGAGVTISCGKFTATTIYSVRWQDATLNDDGSYRTLISGGLHNTAALKNERHTLGEEVLGVRLSCLMRNLKIGLSYAGYSYNRANGVPYKYYNHKRQYDGYHQNIATDAYLVFGNLRLFGECAFSTPGIPYDNSPSCACATLAGLSYAPSDWGVHLLVRYYSDNYIAPHGGAFSTLSAIANQQGVSLRTTVPLYKNLKLYIGTDYSEYPDYRYNIKAPSATLKSYVKIGRSSYYDDNSFWLKVQSTLNSYFYSKTLRSALISVSLNGKLKVLEWLTASWRIRYNSYASTKTSSSESKSYAFQMATTSTLFYERLRVCLGMTVYKAKDWNSVIYLPEEDIPLTLSSSVLYGYGADLYGVIRATITRRLKAYVKIGQRRELLTLKSAIEVKF